MFFREYSICVWFTQATQTWCSSSSHRLFLLLSYVQLVQTSGVTPLSLSWERGVNVQNSVEFASFIQQECLDTNKILASFDVISLFTRIPVALALDVARQRLESDESLCLNATYFSFRGNIYQQIYGTAMGSPVSMVVNLVMEYVESKALATFPQRVRFWKRYVDDVCCSLPEDVVAPFECSRTIY